MARDERDREDLIAEATALSPRAEIALPNCEAPLVVGFRRNGAMSCYFGGDPVYQFNAAHQLRRAFVDGRLIQTRRGKLISMRRERTEGAVQLLSSELSKVIATAWMSWMQGMLSHAAEQLLAGHARIVRQVPDSESYPEVELRERIVREMSAAAQCGEIAERPNA